MNRHTNRRWSLVALVLMLTLVASVLPVVPLTSAVLAETINESGLNNNTAATAQLLERIGRESPLRGQIDPAGDINWYRFEAVEGRTYVVELFNIATTLGGNGFACDRSFGGNGLGMLIYGPALDSRAVAGSCGATERSGSVQTRISFQPTTSGLHYIRVLPNDSGRAGVYSLRVCEGQCATVGGRIFLPLVTR